MLLQTRMKAVLVVLLALGIGWIVLIEYAVVYRSFSRMQDDRVVDDVLRCVSAIRGEADHLETLASDWAAWDEMYRFVQDHNPEFESTNLNAPSMESANLNLLCIADGSNAVIWCHAVDPLHQDQPVPQPLRQSQLPADHPLLALLDPSSDTIRLLRTEAGMMLIAARPITPSSRQGEPKGTVIMGRLFSDANVDRLVQRTHVQFMVWNPGARNLPERVRQVLSEAKVGEVQIDRSEEAKLRAYTVLPDIFGQPTLAIEAAIPRAIAGAGQEATLHACLWIGVMAVILATAVGTFFNHHVMWPILRLRRRILSAARSGDGFATIQAERDDEIGSLAAALNAALESRRPGGTRVEPEEPQAQQDGDRMPQACAQGR